MKEKEEQRLKEKLLPLVKEAVKLSCFGGGMTDKGVWCQCSGSNNQEGHGAKQKEKGRLISKMIAIVKEETGIDVFRVPSTYNDFYFCERKDISMQPNSTSWSAKQVIGMDSNGIIRDHRRYI